MTRKKLLLNFLKFSVSITILYFLLKTLDWSVLSHFNIENFIIILLLISLQIFLGIVSFTILSRAVFNISFLTITRIYVCGVIVGIFTFGVLGEFSVIPLLYKKGISLSKSFSLLFIDKFISLMVYLIFSVIAFILYWKAYSVYAVGIFVIFLLAIAFSLYTKSFRKIVKRYIFDKYITKTTSTFQYFLNYFLYHKKKLFLKTLLSTGRAFLGGVVIWYAIVTLGGKNDLIAVVFISTVARLITFIPVSLNGLGLLEFSGAYALSTIGFIKNHVVIAMLLGRFAMWSLGLILIIITFWLWKEKH